MAKDAPLRLHILSAISDDLEDWERVIGDVQATTGSPVDENAVQRELEALIAEGLVETYELSSPGPEGRLVPATPKPERFREELTYSFFPTEAGMRLYCDATAPPLQRPRFVNPS